MCYDKQKMIQDAKLAGLLSQAHNSKPIQMMSHMTQTSPERSSLCILAALPLPSAAAAAAAHCAVAACRCLSLPS